MLILVLTVNPSMKNYQYFPTAFCYIMQDEEDFNAFLKNELKVLLMKKNTKVFIYGLLTPKVTYLHEKMQLSL